MTVAELIEKLRDEDQAAEVMVMKPGNYTNGRAWYAMEVQKVAGKVHDVGGAVVILADFDNKRSA